jgi:predicted O-methyltransferase YrrM
MSGANAMHWMRYLCGLDEAITQTTEAERQLIAIYAKTSLSLIEIGVFEGVTTRTVADAMPENAVLYAVDPFFKGRLGISWGKLIAHSEVSKCRSKKVVFVEALSEDAAEKIDRDRDFDLIFVDGDHSLTGVATDWKLWGPRCRVGGIMAFHDTRASLHAPQVREMASYKYYNEEISRHPDFKEIDSVDSLSIIRRQC